MKLLCTATYLLLLALNYSFAEVQPRYDTRCSYLMQGIYCFGGATTLNGVGLADNTISYLDIVNNSGISTEELGTKWVTITAITNGIDIKPRGLAQSMELPDGKTMLLSGGWNIGDDNLVSQTVTYNAENNSWAEYSNYTEPPLGNRQIYWASSVYVPGYGVGFYGGSENNINTNWTYQGQNMSQYDGPPGERKIGYTSLTFFDITKSINPWYVFPTQNNLPSVFSALQTSIYDDISKKIFFFGGGFKRNGTSTEMYSFGSSLTFDITSGTWGTQALYGHIPSTRYCHTTTLLKSTNRDVLLYGGHSSDRFAAVVDYCYTLNLDTYEWKQQNIIAPKTAELIRTQHSTVSVNNDTIFIVFGRSRVGQPLLSVIPLNVANPSDISYLETYVDPNGISRPNSGTRLSAGAIAGAVIGSLIGGLIFIGALFCLWKRKKDRKKHLEREELVNQNEIIETPVMEVDWEEIDKRCGKQPNSLPYRPQLSNNSNTVVDNSEFNVDYQHGRSIKPDVNTEIQLPDVNTNDMKSSSLNLQKPESNF